MNEYLSEEIPYNNIPHDHVLAVNICQGLRPKISEDVPKLLADLIMKCWDSKPENRPTARELYQILKKWNSECGNDSSDDSSDNSSDDSNSETHIDDSSNDSNNKCDNNSEIYSQIQECEKIRKNKLKNRIDKNINIQTHPQAIYTSRLLNFKNLPEPVNSTNLQGKYLNIV